MSEYKTIIPGEIPVPQLHGLLLGSVAPRPIAFASTIDKDGNPNLAPFSFFNVFSANPPVLIFSPARRVRGNTTKHTLENILQIPEVVVNVVSYDMVEQMNLASTEYPDGVNEFEKSGLTGIASDLVRPLRVAESPVQMECKVIEVKPLSQGGGAGNLIICQVVKMHIREDIIDADGHIDPHKIDLVSRMGKMYYSRASGDSVFVLDKPGRNHGMGIDAIPAHIRQSEVLTGNHLGQLGMQAEMPSEAEATAFAKELKASGKTSGFDSRNALHQFVAAEFLVKKDVESAWKALLAEKELLN